MSVLLQDKFVGANGTALSAHTPDVGGPWTAVAPGWTIQGNKATPDAAAQVTAPVNSKICRATFGFNWHSAGAGFIELYFTDGGSPEQQLKFVVDNTLDVGFVAVGPASGDFPYANWDSVFPSTGEQQIEIGISSSQIWMKWNGQDYCRCPNPFSRSTIWTKFGMNGGTSTPFPLVSNLLVTRP